MERPRARSLRAATASRSTPTAQTRCARATRCSARQDELAVYGFATILPRGAGGRPQWVKLAVDYLRTPRFDPLELTTKNRSVLALNNPSYLFDERVILREAMSALATMARERKLRAPPITVFAFDRVADAHRALE